MRAFIFGKQTLGDKLVFNSIAEALHCPSEYIGGFVDLSKIKIEDQNIIIILHPLIYNVDFFKVMGKVREDPDKPLVTLRKIKTFGSITFNKDLIINEINTNKIFVFAGFFYLPKKYMKSTISDIFKTMQKEDLRVFILDDNRRSI